MAFPDGTMGAPGLRKERDAGLVTEIIAGKEYVTLAAIADIRKGCPLAPTFPDTALIAVNGHAIGPIVAASSEALMFLVFAPDRQWMVRCGNFKLLFMAPN
jgi:hypothetical protein